MNIHPVSNKKDLTRFIRFPHQLYRGDPNYVPQLNQMQRNLLNPGKNPFFRHSEAAYFLATEGKTVVGRIAAIYNRAHLDCHADGCGFFGFFDSVNDQAVAGELLGAAADFLRKKQLVKMTGPENFTINDSLGILTEGFNDPPQALMPYNYPYYKGLLESQGLTPVIKLFSYYISHGMLSEELYAKFGLVEERLNQKGVRILPMDFNRFDAEAARMRIAYNKANEGSWGFLPLNEEEFQHMAREIRQWIEPENVFLAKLQNEVIGYSLTLPNMNQVFKKIPDGKLFPLGWWHLLRARKYITSQRIMILGVVPNWRHAGIDWCIYARIAQTAKRNNIHWGEACYIMDVNAPMNKMANRLGGKVIKTYQLFEKDL